MSEFNLAAELVRLTELGYAPNIIYDDNGSFAIADEGISQVRMDDDSDFTCTLFGAAEWFKPTPKEAWAAYLQRLRDNGNDV